MNILRPKIHGVLDYAVVLAFLAAPSLFDLTGVAAQLSYALAAIHLAITLLTDFPLGAFKVIPLSIHGWIELAVGPTLVAAAWVPGFTGRAKEFYAAAGVAIFLTWCATDYRAVPR